MEQLIQEWRASLPKFREMTEKFYAKEVSVKEYKGFPEDTEAMPRKAARQACCVCVCRAED